MYQRGVWRCPIHAWYLGGLRNHSASLAICRSNGRNAGYIKDSGGPKYLAGGSLNRCGLANSFSKQPDNPRRPARGWDRVSTSAEIRLSDRSKITFPSKLEIVAEGKSPTSHLEPSSVLSGLNSFSFTITRWESSGCRPKP